MREPWDDYEYIIERLCKGSVDDWIELTQLVDNFPNGVDDWVRRHWITNAIDMCPLGVVIWMLAQGVELRFRDDEGYTPLHAAIERPFDDRAEVLELLVKAGANINEIGLETTTPLHRALLMKADGCAIKLLELGADVHIATVIDWYESAFEYAQRTKHPLLPMIEKFGASATIGKEKT